MQKGESSEWTGCAALRVRFFFLFFFLLVAYLFAYTLLQKYHTHTHTRTLSANINIMLRNEGDLLMCSIAIEICPITKKVSPITHLMKHTHTRSVEINDHCSTHTADTHTRLSDESSDVDVVYLWHWCQSLRTRAVHTHRKVLKRANCGLVEI